MLSPTQTFTEGQQLEPQMEKKKSKWIDQAIPEQTHQSRKRKRDNQSIQKSLNCSIKLMSQLSVSQAAVPKKTKLSSVEIMLSNSEINTLK